MAEITDVDIVDGVPTTGTGTVPTLSKTNTVIGAVTETAPATDTASSGLNGRLQRIAQRISSMIALLPTALGAGGGLKVDGSGTALPVSLDSVPSHAVTNAGTFVTQENGALLTAAQLLDDNMVAQGTALGSTKNALIGASVTTSAPTYTTGQINPLSMDTTGALRVTGGGGGTQYTEDAAAASDPVGNMLMAVRRDTLSASEVSADGDNIALKATNKGKLHVAAEVRFGDVVADLGSGTGGSATQRVIIDSSQFQSPGQNTKSNSTSFTIASDQGYAGNVGGITVTQAASSTITRPADTTAYAVGDLVTNSVTAGSVNNLQFTTLARISGGSGMIVGAKIQKSTNSITNAAFRLHLFNTAPTYTSAGDNSAISTVVVASGKGYLGYVDIQSMMAFSDVAWGTGSVDNARGGICFVATAQIIYGLVEARGTYTPGSAEVFTITLDALQD
jgi:hypothetical protein